MILKKSKPVLLICLFYTYVFICSFLPSGNILNLPVKFPFFALLSVAFFYDCFKHRFSVSRLNLTLLFAILFFVFFSTIISLVNYYDIKSVMKELQAILIFVLTLDYSIIIYENTPNKNNFFITTIVASIYGSFCFLVFKSFLFFGLLFNLFDYNFVEKCIFKMLNYKPVGLGLATGGSRFSFVTLDFLSVFLFALFIYFRGSFRGNIINSSLFCVVYMFFFLISLFSAYSRALFLVFPLLLVLVLFIRRKYKTIVLLSICCAVFIFTNISQVQAVINQRFVNQNHSDKWRELMISNLLDYWQSGLFLGKGLGSYVPYFIRDQTLKYSYEVQLLSLIMQFGVFFIVVVIVVNLFFIYFANKSKYLILVYLSFLILLVLSMTNQYLLNSTSTNVIVIVVLSFIHYGSNSRRGEIKRSLENG